MDRVEVDGVEVFSSLVSISISTNLRVGFGWFETSCATVRVASLFGHVGCACWLVWIWLQQTRLLLLAGNSLDKSWCQINLFC